MPSFHKGAILYRKLRHRKGHGVHSPFVYNLITKVIEEKSPYYAFDKINGALQGPNYQINKSKLVIIKKKQEHKYGALLFRLINFFKCKVVLQIGSPEESVCLYMASANSESNCFVLEEDELLCLKINDLINKTGLNNLDIKCGDYTETVNQIFEQEKKADLVFINIPTHKDCQDILAKCISNSEENCIFVINGIRTNRRMRAVWKHIIENSQISISIDLYTSGIFFLRKNIYKQHYKAYFDHGKEQNIYKNGRQRFYVFGRRKTSL